VLAIFNGYKRGTNFEESRPGIGNFSYLIGKRISKWSQPQRDSQIKPLQRIKYKEGRNLTSNKPSPLKVSGLIQSKNPPRRWSPGNRRLRGSDR